MRFYGFEADDNSRMSLTPLDGKGRPAGKGIPIPVTSVTYTHSEEDEAAWEAAAESTREGLTRGGTFTATFAVNVSGDWGRLYTMLTNWPWRPTKAERRRAKRRKLLARIVAQTRPRGPGVDWRGGTAYHRVPIAAIARGSRGRPHPRTGYVHTPPSPAPPVEAVPPTPGDPRPIPAPVARPAGVTEFCALASRLFALDEMGGPLHVHLDDHNTELLVGAAARRHIEGLTQALALINLGQVPETSASWDEPGGLALDTAYYYGPEWADERNEPLEQLRLAVKILTITEPWTEEQADAAYAHWHRRKGMEPCSCDVYPDFIEEDTNEQR